MEEKIWELVDEIINPKLLEHNGWVEVDKIVEDIVYIRFRGVCSGCVTNQETKDNIVKPELMKHFENIKDVVILEYETEEMIDIARSILGKSK